MTNFWGLYVPPTDVLSTTLSTWAEKNPLLRRRSPAIIASSVQHRARLVVEGWAKNPPYSHVLERKLMGAELDPGSYQVDVSVDIPDEQSKMHINIDVRFKTAIERLGGLSE